MENPVFEFLARHSSLIITTHSNPDADGLGAERVFSAIARSLGKAVRIVNSDPMPERFTFMDPEQTIETWAQVKGPLPREAAMVMVDTADEYNIGELRDLISGAPEVFVIDHHEPNKFNTFKGYIDAAASSTCEIAVELAGAAGIPLSPDCAAAAYAGIVYDTGFFAYSKTTGRTFNAALSLIKAGVNPYQVYQELNENASMGALLLQKKVLSTLEIHNEGRVAVQILRREDLETCGADIEDAENFINLPMKSRDIKVSVLLKETREGKIRCSLRSRGTVNVSKIAQGLGGGGHVSAAGFKSSLGVEDTLGIVLERVTEALDKT